MITIEGIIEKQLSRILKIIMFLSISNKSIDELSVILGVNEKTIKSDIIHFNTEYSGQQILIDELKQASLDVNQEVNAFDLCQNILKNSYNTLVLYQIIKDEPTIKNISESKFISVTSVRRVIEKINSCFEENGLDMKLIKTDNQRIKLIGDELLIREMGTALLSDVFTKKEYEEYKWLSEELSIYFDKCRIELTQEVHKRLLLQMIVSLFRVKNGSMISDEIIREAGNKEFIRLFSEDLEKNISFVSRLQVKFRISISEKVIEQLFHFPLKHIADNIVLQKESLNENELEQHQKCLNFIDDFMKEFDISEETHQQLMFQTFKMLSFPKKMNVFQIDINSIFYEQISCKNPELIARFEKCLQKYKFPESFMKYTSYKSALFLSYFMLSDELLETVEKGMSEKSVLIFSEEDVRIELMYKKMITKKFPHLTKVICYNNLSESEKKQSFNQHDLILSDKCLNDINYIRISNVPTLLFWQSFEKNIKL